LTAPKRNTLFGTNLCEQLILAFATKMSQGELRNAFQRRQWRLGKRFASYFEEKIMLANDINIDKEELFENIIEGVLALELRDQARIQCFAEPVQILKSFSGIRLPERKQEMNSSQRSSGKIEDTKDFRCANCNSKGHYAKDCLKPKREPGSCYACGKFGHFMGQCPERKSANAIKYVRYIQIFFYNSPKTPLIAACLIYAGSPISFAKTGVISKIKTELVSENYFVLNKSQLKIFVRILCYIIKERLKCHFYFYIVTNESMSHEVVPGRNFMDACNLELDLSTLKMITIESTIADCNKSV